MGKQRGVSLMGLIITLAVLGFLGIMAAKLMPAYLEFASVKKIFAAMDQAGDIKSLSVREVRSEFDKRNAIENVTSIKSDDIEVTKDGGETIMTVAWSVKVPMVANVSACLDFMVTTAK